MLIAGPTGNRLARTYTQVGSNGLQLDTWPANNPSLNPSLHDLRYYQGLLAHAANFKGPGDSEYTMLELDADGQFKTYTFFDDISILSHLQSDRHAKAEIHYRLILCTLAKVDKEAGAAFHHRTSLSSEVTAKVLETFKVSPQFLPKLVGEPDYLAPAFFEHHDPATNGLHPQFMCQHPRWYIHKSETPISAYMSFDPSKKCTTYIMSSSEESTASLDSGKTLFNELRHRLYNVLDIVDKYARGEHDDLGKERAVLEGATVSLHNVSQDIDSTAASLDMGTRIVEALHSASKEYSIRLHPDFHISQLQAVQAARYLADSHVSQKGWLLSWKSRKDIAMNLVFNLVTQQDAASSHATARLTQNDGNSMKAIAALTMIFLPAMFMATVHGMNSYKNATWTSYWVATVPLTLVVLFAWFLWTKFFPGRSRARSKAKSKDRWRWIRFWRRIKDIEVDKKLDIEAGRGDPQLSPISTGRTLVEEPKAKST